MRNLGRIVDLSKVKELRLIADMNHGIYKELKQLMKPGCALKSIKFEINGTTEATYSRSLYHFINFIIPFAPQIRSLDFEVLESFNSNYVFSLRSIMDHFTSLKKIKIFKLCPYRTNMPQTNCVSNGRVIIHNLNLFECISNKTGLKKIYITTNDSTQLLSTAHFIQTLNNNKDTLVDLRVSRQKFEGDKIRSCDHFDQYFNITLEFLKLRKIAKVMGQSSIVKDFNDFKKKMQEHVLRNVHERLIQKLPLEIIEKCIEFVNINAMMLEDIRRLIGILEIEKMEHLVRILFEKFYFSEPCDVLHESEMFDFMFVFNRNPLFVQMFFECIGHKKIKAFLDIFIHRLLRIRKAHSEKWFFHEANQNNVLFHMFNSTKNLNDIHFTGSTYHQLLSIHFNGAYNQIIATDSDRQISYKKTVEPENCERSSKRIKIKKDTEEHDISCYTESLPEVCIKEIFTFVENTVCQKEFNPWIPVCLVCKDWRNIYLKTFILENHGESGLKFTGLPKFNRNLKNECEEMIHQTNKDFSKSKGKISKRKIMNIDN